MAEIGRYLSRDVSSNIVTDSLISTKNLLPCNDDGVPQLFAKSNKNTLSTKFLLTMAMRFSPTRPLPVVLMTWMVLIVVANVVSASFIVSRKVSHGVYTILSTAPSDRTIRRPVVGVSATKRTERCERNKEASGNDDLDHCRRRLVLDSILLGSGGAVLLAQPLICNALFGLPDVPTAPPSRTTAKDRMGSDVVLSTYLQTHRPNDFSLVQGLKGDPAYLIVSLDGSALLPYALNAECTHLGCVVPYDEAQLKFICPCHGSQYDKEGRVLRGPAPSPLSLEKVISDDESGKLLLEPWTNEVDFRTGLKGWWVS
jgi:cytochrome b6-f complex iron-sulfur subunit